MLPGHGGNDFLKFRDREELLGQDLADALEQMHARGRYREVLLLIETCQVSCSRHRTAQSQPLQCSPFMPRLERSEFVAVVLFLNESLLPVDWFHGG